MKIKRITAAAAAAVGIMTFFSVPADAQKYASYTWEAGVYWTEPGGELCIAPMVYSDPGNIMALQFDLATPAIDHGAIKPTVYGDSDGYIGTAYPTFSDMMFNMEKMHIGGSDSGLGLKGVDPAEDGSTICEMWYDVADEASVVKAAKASGMKPRYSNENDSWYYSFVLKFDPSINPAAGSPMCEAVLTDETQLQTTYIEGSINITISDETAAAETSENSGGDTGNSSSGGGENSGASSNSGSSRGNTADSSGGSGGRQTTANSNQANISKTDIYGDDTPVSHEVGSDEETTDIDGDSTNETQNVETAAAQEVDISESGDVEIKEIGADDQNKNGSKKIVIFIAAGAVVLAAGGGAGAYYFIKKKK